MFIASEAILHAIYYHRPERFDRTDSNVDINIENQNKFYRPKEEPGKYFLLSDKIEKTLCDLRAKNSIGEETHNTLKNVFNPKGGLDDFKDNNQTKRI